MKLGKLIWWSSIYTHIALSHTSLLPSFPLHLSLADSSQEQYFPDPSLDSPDPDFDDHRTQILNEALKLVSEYGWSGGVLSEAAKSLGLSGVMEEGELFPRGPGNLVDHFEQQCNQKLNQIMEKLANENRQENHVIARKISPFFLPASPLPSGPLFPLPPSLSSLYPSVVHPSLSHRSDHPISA